MWNTIKLNRVLLVISLLTSLTCYTQTTIINQQFSSTSPAGWSSTSNTWILNYDGTSTSNFRSASYSARFPSAANGNAIFLYIPVNFKLGYTYNVSFYTKRACSATINYNETANQTTLLRTISYTNTSCSSNWNTWYGWSDVYSASYDGAGYIQIQINTVYGGPASVYLDDISVTENPPVALPIELIYFNVKTNCEGQVISKWATASEYNVWKYIIMYSLDDTNYMRLDSIEDIGTSTNGNRYEMTSRIVYESTIVYVKLREVDYDGYQKDFDPESVYIPKYCKQQSYPRVILRRYNIYGQEVDESYNGFVIILYSDNTTEYKIN